MPTNNPNHPRASEGFATTQWSLVKRLHGANEQESQQALAWLCERYWFPLYAFVRRRGHPIQEAEDLTQSFFARLLEKEILSKASPELGRFRTFLLAAMKNFLANEWDRATAQKRGGGKTLLSLDLSSAEARLNHEPAHQMTPERSFERQWALTLLNLVSEKLATEFAAEGKSKQFEQLKGAITAGRTDLPYFEIAVKLGISEETARQAASRLRKRYRELLRMEVADTVALPSQIDDEIRSLFDIFGA